MSWRPFQEEDGWTRVSHRRRGRKRRRPGGGEELDRQHGADGPSFAGPRRWGRTKNHAGPPWTARKQPGDLQNEREYDYREPEWQPSRPRRQVRHRSGLREVRNRARTPPDHVMDNAAQGPPASTQDERSFGSNVRLLNKLIKAVHHLDNITRGEPPAIQRLKEHLATVIKPAIPCDVTLSQIRGNALNWAYTTQLILEDHYKSLLLQVKVDLRTHSLSEMEAPFEIAAKWARQSLGRRLNQSTLDHAHQTMRDAIFDSSFPPLLITLDPPAQRPPPTAVAAPPSRDDVIQTQPPPSDHILPTAPLPAAPLPKRDPDTSRNRQRGFNRGPKGAPAHTVLTHSAVVHQVSVTTTDTATMTEVNQGMSHQTIKLSPSQAADVTAHCVEGDLIQLPSGGVPEMQAVMVKASRRDSDELSDITILTNLLAQHVEETARAGCAVDHVEPLRSDDPDPTSRQGPAAGSCPLPPHFLRSSSHQTSSLKPTEDSSSTTTGPPGVPAESGLVSTRTGTRRKNLK